MRGRPLQNTRNLPLNARLSFLWGKSGYETSVLCGGSLGTRLMFYAIYMATRPRGRLRPRARVCIFHKTLAISITYIPCSMHKPEAEAGYCSYLSLFSILSQFLPQQSVTQYKSHI